MEKNILNILAVCILSFALTFTAGCGNDEAVIELSEEPVARENRIVTDSKAADEPAGSVTVYVCGAVNRPGVYELENGSRIVDAVAMASGMTELADLYYVNQAMLLEDGQKVYIPTEEETSVLTPGEAADPALGGSSQENGDKVNINTADAATLMTLPGIGEAKAELIIKYRTDNGRFNSIEDIMKISGIKEGMFNRIRDKICL